MAYTRIKRGLFSTEIRTVAGDGPPPPEPPEEPWYKRPLGLILIGAVSGLIVAGVVYWLGWNK